MPYQRTRLWFGWSLTSNRPLYKKADLIFTLEKFNQDSDEAITKNICLKGEKIEKFVGLALVFYKFHSKLKLNKVDI